MVFLIIWNGKCCLTDVWELEARPLNFDIFLYLGSFKSCFFLQLLNLGFT